MVSRVARSGAVRRGQASVRRRAERPIGIKLSLRSNIMRRPFGRPAKSLWIAALVCAGLFVGYMAAHGICSRSSQTVGSMYAFEPGSLDTFLVVLTAVAGMFGLLFGIRSTEMQVFCFANLHSQRHSQSESRPPPSP